MPLWTEFLGCLQPLRPAFSRQATFRWMVFIVAMFAIRSDVLGVSSFIRAAGIQPACYDALVHFFRSTGVRVESLTALWVQQVLKLFAPVEVDGYRVCVADGLQSAREGTHMPAVKSLYTHSSNNSKPPYIMGHSFQALALLVRSRVGAVLAVPLVARISEGLVFSNRDQRSLLDKLVHMAQPLFGHMGKPVIMVADAYYCSRTVIAPLLALGHHLLTRAKRNVVAYEPAPTPQTRRRGRPKVYGKKVQLRAYFEDMAHFIEATSPVYGEKHVILSYACRDLLWKPVGKLVRFVLVVHPTRGRIILMCTHMELDPLTIIELYGYRFKIEVMFKQAIHVLGTYTYHFWMKAMTPIRRGGGNQYLHKTSPAYRAKVRETLDAYHRFVQLGCIAHGLVLHLSANHPDTVWSHFRGWLRTLRPDTPASELVVCDALSDGFPEFLRNAPETDILKKFIRQKADPRQAQGLRHAS